MTIRVLVVTIVHRPQDARILHREIGALREADATVTYAAPWSSTRQAPPPGLATVDLPRATGRRRLSAMRAARRAIAELGRDHDVVVLHDPELLLAIEGLSGLPPVVWDVHEDVAASLTDRDWIPRWAVGGLRRLVHKLEHRWERRHHLILAEPSYLHRFAGGKHPVVPNVPLVPDQVTLPGSDRVVYLGRCSRSRGIPELVQVAERLAGELEIEVIGYADPDVTTLLQHAAQDGILRWRDFMPNDVALTRLDGALAGVSLLRDAPNFRGSMPTKVYEYMARGVPVVSTPLPEAARVVDRYGCGIVVPFEDPDAAVDALRRLRDDPTLRSRLGRAGHAAARSDFDWTRHGPRFAALIEQIVHGTRTA